MRQRTFLLVISISITAFILPIFPTFLEICGASTRATTLDTYMVEMDDGVLLATDVHSPEEGGARGSILVRTPYDRERSGIYASWARQGWNGIAQDTRGRYDSGGDSDFPILWYAHTDGTDTLKWIEQRSWSDGKVATYGGSALGVAQYRMAGQDPSALTCQFITQAPPDMYYYSAYQGGQFKKMNLGELMIDNPYPEKREIYDNENFSLGFWGNLSLLDKWSSVNVPAIHAGGWFDGFSEGTIDAFMGYNYKGGPGARNKSKLVMGPWVHGDIAYPNNYGDIEFPDGWDGAFTEDMFYDMLDQYMVGTSNAFDDWPTVTYYVIGDETDPDAPGMEWRTSDIWPVPSNITSLYFHSNGSLDPRPPLYENHSMSYDYDPSDPVPTAGGQNFGANSGLKDQSSVENRDDVILFETPILQEPVEATGKIRADLFVSSDRYDTDFTVKVTDVYPDGRSILVTDGIIRMRNRNGSDHWEFMEPGETYEVDVDMWSTSYVWNIGHRIRVAVSSSNYPRFLNNPNTRDGIYANYGYLIANNTLFLDRTRPSSLILPVVGNYPNLPPIIERVPDVDQTIIDDLSSVNLSIRVTDENISDLTYIWKVDGAVHHGGNISYFIYQADGKGDGDHFVSVIVRDTGDPAFDVSVGWNIKIRNIDTPPELIDTDPADDIELYERTYGEQLFSIKAEDQDPYPDHIIWELDGEKVLENTSEYIFQFDHNSSGNYILDVEFGDLYSSLEHQWKIHVIDVNRPPVLTQIDGPDPETVLYETEEGVVDLKVKTFDPDGDKVDISWYLNGNLVSHIDSYGFHYNHTSAGIHKIEVIADDGSDNATMNWTIEVLEVNRAPKIIFFEPSTTGMEVEEKADGSIAFSIVAYDEDEDPLSFRWSIDDSLIEAEGREAVFEYSHSSSGIHIVMVIVTDGKDRTEMTWRIEVIDVNRPPLIISRSPQVDDMIIANSSVELTVDALDQDGDPLEFTWMINETLVLQEDGTGSITIDRYDFPGIGEFHISVHVDDGKGGKAVSTWSVEVEPLDQEPGKGPDDEVPVNDTDEAAREDGSSNFPWGAMVIISLSVIGAALVTTFLLFGKKHKVSGAEEGPVPERDQDQVSETEETA